jgi:thiol-disulfide isomerase/thioredoxin
MKAVNRILASLALLAAALPALAAELPFNQQLFDQLRASGQPVAVHFYATWCNVCKKQREITSGLLKQPEFSKLTLLSADIDHEQALMQTLKVASRSTLIVYKGPQEVGRTVADTNPDSLAALLRQAL